MAQTIANVSHTHFFLHKQRITHPPKEATIYSTHRMSWLENNGEVGGGKRSSGGRGSGGGGGVDGGIGGSGGGNGSGGGGNGG